ncbi:LOW QUALITY PROTEIN: resistin-like beta [Sarcophilus harrisii]|uniref:LOW QUALITY PROTEIN: resistin-like beta n=1 Tax=Sarcophilus harrisii TaxID=9305 RepID=UPI001301BF36|nr:LOW QUALITY PROTEIN: resistin-like beta [Sarcophilus harrisii]
MKPALLFLLILMHLLAQLSPGHAECCLKEIEFIVEKKVQDALSTLEIGTKRPLSCTSVTNRGTLATCPAGFIVTGCACGYGCGSWDVRGDNTCHCQCQAWIGPVLDAARIPKEGKMGTLILHKIMIFN